MKRLLMILLAAGLMISAGCDSNGQTMNGNDMDKTYTQIDQETAKEMMARDDGHVVVDVRRQDEYDAGHIPGAILIPNESIGTERPEELPDLNQIILIYCRSGNRSKQAAQKLFDMGYTQLYEFGGINTWTGEITGEDVTMKNTPAVLYFDSFDGGGPEYEAEIGDPTIVSVTQGRSYSSPDHGEIDGASFSVIFTFTGLKPGETRVEITSWSPIVDGERIIYALKVDERLNVTAQYLSSEELGEPVKPMPVLVVDVDGRYFYAIPEDNSSAEAFVDALNSGPIAVEMSDCGGFEKGGPLPWTLPRNDEEITTKPGDVILYQGNQITLYYDQITGSFTRLAGIGNLTKEKLLEAFGEGSVTVSFWLEWSE